MTSKESSCKYSCEFSEDGYIQLMAVKFPKGTLLLFFFKNQKQSQRRFAALMLAYDILLLEDKSMQKLLSLKRARKEDSVGFDGLNYIGTVDSAHRVEKNSLRSNSFSTVPMDMGMLGCS